MDFQSVLWAILALAVIVCLRWLADRSGWKFDELRTIVAMLVEEAEQTMPGESGEEKLGWVLLQCDGLGVTKWIPRAVLSAMIESTVYRLKQGRVGDGVGVEYDGKPRG